MKQNKSLKVFIQIAHTLIVNVTALQDPKRSLIFNACFHRGIKVSKCRLHAAQLLIKGEPINFEGGSRLQQFQHKLLGRSRRVNFFALDRSRIWSSQQSVVYIIPRQVFQPNDIKYIATYQFSSIKSYTGKRSKNFKTRSGTGV